MTDSQFLELIHQIQRSTTVVIVMLLAILLGLLFLIKK